MQSPPWVAPGVADSEVRASLSNGGDVRNVPLNVSSAVKCIPSLQTPPTREAAQAVPAAMSASNRGMSPSSLTPTLSGGTETIGEPSRYYLALAFLRSSASSSPWMSARSFIASISENVGKRREAFGDVGGGGGVEVMRHGMRWRRRRQRGKFTLEIGLGEHASSHGTSRGPHSLLRARSQALTFPLFSAKVEGTGCRGCSSRIRPIAKTGPIGRCCQTISWLWLDWRASAAASLVLGGQPLLPGFLHDLGKYSAAFQRRLDGSGEAVDHSTAGAKQVGRLVVGGADRGMAELIAVCDRGPSRRAS